MADRLARVAEMVARGLRYVHDGDCGRAANMLGGASFQLGLECGRRDDRACFGLAQDRDPDVSAAFEATTKLNAAIMDGPCAARPRRRR